MYNSSGRSVQFGAVRVFNSRGQCVQFDAAYAGNRASVQGHEEYSEHTACLSQA